MKEQRQPEWAAGREVCEDEKGDEIEAEFVPISPRRLRQAGRITAALVVLAGAGLIAALSNQAQQATRTGIAAIAAQHTAAVQLTALAAQMSDTQRIAGTAAAGRAQAESRSTATLAESRSRQLANALAYAALAQLEVDPDRSILIALEANRSAHTQEAEDALRRALDASHVRLAWRVGTDDGNVREAHYSPDGQRILTVAEGYKQTDEADESLTPRVWDAKTGKLLFALRGHTATVIHAEYSPGGTRILTVSKDHSVRVWRAKDGMLILMRQAYQDSITHAALAPDIRRIAVATSEGLVRIWNTDNGEELLVLREGFADDVEVEWSSDGSLLLGRSLSGVTIWNTYSAELLFKESPGERSAVDAHFSPDGRQMVTTGLTGIAIRDATTGEWMHTLRTLLDEGNQDVAQFSSDGMHLLTSSSQPRLWDVGTGWLIFTFPTLNTQAYLSTDPPDGTLVATCCDESGATVWRLESNGYFQSAEVLRGDMAYLWGFSPDGRSLLTTSNDGTLRVWDIMAPDKLPERYEDLLALAHTRVTRELTCEERQEFLGEHGACVLPVSGQ